MKRWEIIAFVLLCLAIVVFVSSCANRPEPGSMDWVRDQQRQAAYQALHDCMSAYRAQRWPNQVIFPNGGHPCIKCQQGSAQACAEAYGK